MTGGGVAALAWPLAALLAKATVVLLAAALGAWLARRRTASLRHAVWMAGMLALPALALLQPALPRLAVAPPLLSRVASSPAAGLAAVAEAAAPGAPRAAVPRAAVAPPALPWRALAGALYLLGLAALLLRLAVGCARLRRIRRAGSPAPADLRREAARVAAEAALRRPFRIVVGDGLPAPATWGLLRPVLFLPAAFAAWPPARRRRALLHELAHVRRLDGLWTFAAELVAALCWPHPLGWWARHRRRAESEAACDDAVLRHEEPGAYAADLLLLARDLTRRPAPAAASAGNAGTLRQRLVALFARDPRGPLRRREAVAVAAAALALALPLAAIGPSHASPPGAAQRPGARSEAQAGWVPQQLRWTAPEGHGGLFLDGLVDLGALGTPEVAAPGGLALLYAHGRDGVLRSFALWHDGSGPRSMHREGADPAAGVPEWLAPLLATVTRGRDDGASALSTTRLGVPRGDAFLPAVSGSHMVGLPAWSEDPRAGVAQGGWEQDGRRAGLVYRGRVAIREDGEPVLRSPGAWLAAFTWDSDAELRTVEVTAAAGIPVVTHAVNGEPAPFDAAAGHWLREIAEGYRRQSPAGWPGPALAP